jgi:hypothetical protein
VTSLYPLVDLQTLSKKEFLLSETEYLGKGSYSNLGPETLTKNLKKDGVLFCMCLLRPLFTALAKTLLDSFDAREF